LLIVDETIPQEDLDNQEPGDAPETTMPGLGTAVSPYLIRSVEEFMQIVRHPNAHFKLENDIDMGLTNGLDVDFAGVFDGNGYTISNVRNANLGTGNTGLFRALNQAAIRNLTIHNASVSGKNNYTGVLAGTASSSVLENITVLGDITVKGVMYTGGLLGWASNTVFSNCTINGVLDISGTSSVGGLAGALQNSTARR